METPDRVTGPVNLGNPAEFTIRELAQKILNLTNARSRIVYRPLPPDDPVRRRPVIDLARDQLEWQPTTPFDEGLGRTIAYFRELPRAEERDTVAGLAAGVHGHAS
jgi:UDP-glucuronate decarboxylase